MPMPALLIQTQYAELLERVEAAAFEQAFPEPGNFLVKHVDARRYWYFQAPRVAGQPRPQRYVGPETAELLVRIEAHRRQLQDRKERRALVAALVRSGRMPQPLPRMGKVVEALARAGLFRLRAVLVGTRSFGKGIVQTVSPLGNNGAMALTTARYYTPSGRSIQGLGITPDVEVAMTREERPSFFPAREADYKGILSNTGGAPTDSLAPRTDLPAIAKDIPKKPPEGTPAFDPAKPETDFQLQQALIVLHAMSPKPAAN